MNQSLEISVKKDYKTFLDNQEILTKIFYQFLQPGDLPGKIKMIMGLLGVHMGLDRVYIYENHDMGEITRNSFEWCNTGVRATINRIPRRSPENKFKAWRKEIYEHEKIKVSHINELPREVQQYFATTQTISVMILPLYVHRKFFGFLGIEDCKSERHWTNEEEDLLHVFGKIIADNVYERVLPNQNLKESEEKFQYLLDNCSDSILIVDLDLNFIDANQAATKMFNYSHEELIKMDARNLILNKYIDAVKQYVDQLGTLKRVVYDYVVAKSGKIIPVQFISKAINYNGTDAILIIIRDITDRKQEEQKVFKAIIETEERERKRIAKDLHDGLGPLLSTVKLYVNELQSGDVRKKEKQELLSYTNDLIDDAISNTKTISNNLVPTVIRDYGIVPAIESFIKKMNNTEIIHIDFKTLGIQERFERTLEITLYRITKELINNTMKHAKARNVNITLKKEQQMLHLHYEDDGIGFDVQRKLSNSHNGMGLNNILNRTKSLNGNCIINSTPGRGMKVNIEFEI